MGLKKKQVIVRYSIRAIARALRKAPGWDWAPTLKERNIARAAIALYTGTKNYFSYKDTRSDVTAWRIGSQIVLSWDERELPRVPVDN